MIRKKNETLHVDQDAKGSRIIFFSGRGHIRIKLSNLVLREEKNTKNTKNIEKIKR
jgi:hypothetical protein